MDNILLLLFFGIGSLFALIATTAWIARRMSAKASGWISGILSVAGLCSFIYWMTVLMHNTSYSPGWRMALIPICFAPLYAAIGFMIGNMHVSRHDDLEKRLADWRKRLPVDAANETKPLPVAHDLHEIGKLLDHLERYDEALDAYDRAYRVYEAQMSGHPTLNGFYHSYATLLRRAGRHEEATSVERQARAATVGTGE